MPDLDTQTKVAGVTNLIENYSKLAKEGRRPGIGAYAEKRVPELEAALERHKASL